MNRKIRILIIEDHPLMANATKDQLAKIEFVEVVGLAYDAMSGLKLVEELTPDMVFLDFNLPDLFGDEVARRIKARHPQIHIIIFSGIDLTDLYNCFIEIQVSGIISKESIGEVLVDMINSIMKGQTIVPLSVFHQLRLSDGAVPRQVLSEDEHNLMDMVIRGYTNEQIALEIHMSKRSVDNYLKKIYQKLGVKLRTQAISNYLENHQR